MTDLDCELLTELLGQLQDEADHAAGNVEEWNLAGPHNNQARLWRKEATEKQAYADALRRVLGLPPREEDDDD